MFLTKIIGIYQIDEDVNICNMYISYYIPMR